MKILFAGGGTLGSVTPLLAVAEVWKRLDPVVEFVWVGTPQGPERAPVEEEGIRFLTLPVARLTRYPSLEWLMLPFQLVRAIVRAFRILKTERPNLVATAGGYTGVPLIAVAKALGIPSWMHQSDVRPILSSRLAAPFASWITTAFESTAIAFPTEKTEVIGNPVRASVLVGERDSAVRRFGLDSSLPTLLVLGGGGGSLWINNMMGIVEIEFRNWTNVIHLTGRGKNLEAFSRLGPRYVAREFLTEGMADALAVADVVVCRAGMGTLTELAALGKAAVVIPLPNSPQEENAQALQDAGAAVVLHQGQSGPSEFLEAVHRLLVDAERRNVFTSSIRTFLRTDCAEHLVRRLKPLAK